MQIRFGPAIYYLLIVMAAVSLVMGEEIVRDFDRSYNFSQLKTYRWMEAERRLISRARPATTAELSDEELDEMIRAAVDEQLKKRGFTLSNGDSADFLVTYFAAGELEVSGSFYDAAPSGSLPYNHWRPFYEPTSDVRMNSKGTLTIDIVDPQTSKLVWRGQATDTIKSTKDTGKTVKKVSKKILSKFPPG